MIPKGIGTVIWTCINEGQLHTNKVNNVLYFPYSPVNILSATVLTESMNFDEVTWVQKYIYVLFVLGIG